MQKWNVPRSRVQILDEKNGVLCLVIMFIQGDLSVALKCFSLQMTTNRFSVPLFWYSSFFSFKYIYSFFFPPVSRLFSLFYLREHWDICLCCIFLPLFWLSLSKIFFIYFLSCPIVIYYIVEKKSFAHAVTNFFLSSAENTKKSHVLHFNNHNSGSKCNFHYFVNILAPFFSSNLWALSVGFSHLCIPRTSKFHFRGPPFALCSGL